MDIFNMGKSQKHYYAMFKKPDTKHYTLWFHIYEILGKAYMKF